MPAGVLQYNIGFSSQTCSLC